MIVFRRLWPGFWRGVFDIATVLVVGVLIAHAWWHYKHVDYEIEDYNEWTTHLS